MKSEEKGENSDGTLADPGKVRGVKKTESEEKSNETSTAVTGVKIQRAMEHQLVQAELVARGELFQACIDRAVGFGWRPFKSMTLFQIFEAF